MARAPKPPKARPTPKIVRRHDSLGRPYYTRESTGERVKKSSWERDLARRDKERSAAQYERARADAEEKDRRRRAKEERERAKKPKRPATPPPEAPKAPKGPKKPPKGPRRGPGRPPELPAPPPPFPPGVSGEGVPERYVDEDGVEWDAHEVEGDDET